MTGPALLDDEVPCTCYREDGRNNGHHARVPTARPGKQWRCRCCGGVSPLQPGPPAVTTGVGWPS